MSRPVRIEFPDALYHVTARGDRREDIFDDDQDRRTFLSTLEQVITQLNLLIQTPDGNLSKGMRQLKNAAIVAAYATGEYSYQQIADYFGMHFTTVGNIVRGSG